MKQIVLYVNLKDVDEKAIIINNEALATISSFIARKDILEISNIPEIDTVTLILSNKDIGRGVGSLLYHWCDATSVRLSNDSVHNKAISSLCKRIRLNKKIVYRPHIEI